MKTSGTIALVLGSALLAPVTSRAAVTVTWQSLNNGDFRAVVTGSFSAAELAEAAIVDSISGGYTAYYDTTPAFGVAETPGTYDRYLFSTSKLTITPAIHNLNTYSGNTATGDTFAFTIPNSYLFLVLEGGYQADAPINSTLVAEGYGLPLSFAFAFGDVVKLNGNPFITYVNGGAVPEPSTYGLMAGGLALAAVAVRRRKKSSK